MGSWGSPLDESDQDLERDAVSWLIDGSTAIENLKRATGIDQLPEEKNHETAAGFMMLMLRNVPKPTDSVEYAGGKLEVVDVNNYRIDSYW